MNQSCLLTLNSLILSGSLKNGKYVKHKGRVVAKGYLQKRTSDFSSFSPTASQVTLRVILALTAMVGFKRWDLDATYAFYQCTSS